VVSDDPGFTLGVHLLSQPGSGELMPNLNRWEGQLGLPASSPGEAPKHSKTIQVEGHDGHRVDLTGTDAKSRVSARLLAVVVPDGDRAWSFSLKGPPEKVAAQEKKFDAFIASIHFPTHNHGDADAGSESAGAATQPADNRAFKMDKFTLPSGWVAEPSDKPFRVATFFTASPSDNARAELIVSKLPGNRFGQMIDNVNRWRREVKLAAISDLGAQPVRRSDFAGHPAATFTFDPGNAAAPDARASSVAMIPLGRDVWFFKLIGPAKTVADQRASFDAFLQSLQFGEAGE